MLGSWYDFPPGSPQTLIPKVLHSEKKLALSHPLGVSFWGVGQAVGAIHHPQPLEKQWLLGYHFELPLG